MAELWDDWDVTCKSLAQKLKSDPRSYIQNAGAEFYPVKAQGEVWFGWAIGNAGKHKCIGIIREAKKEAGIRLLLHLDPTKNLIWDPNDPNGSGRPFRLSAPNPSDRDRGEILLTHAQFPDQLYSWIACAIRHTASERKPKTDLSTDVLAAIASLEQQPAMANLEQKPLSASEGKRLLCIHKRIERSRKLVKEKKTLVLGLTGDLKCEVCRFSFREVYGQHGEGFAECHHIKPLAEIMDESLTDIGDLAIVCANCHRMLHRRPYPSIEALQQHFK